MIINSCDPNSQSWIILFCDIFIYLSIAIISGLLSTTYVNRIGYNSPNDNVKSGCLSAYWLGDLQLDRKSANEHFYQGTMPYGYLDSWLIKDNRQSKIFSDTLSNLKTELRIAILDFEWAVPTIGGKSLIKPSEGHALAKVFRVMLDTALVQTRKFTVVERTYFSKVIEEMNLQFKSGIVDPQSLQKWGKQLGADYLMMGAISQFMVSQRKCRLRGMDFIIAELVMTVDIRIVSVESGAIVFAESVRVGLPFGVKNASKAMCQSLKRLLFTMTILRTDK